MQSEAFEGTNVFFPHNVLHDDPILKSDECEPRRVPRDPDVFDRGELGKMQCEFSDVLG